MCMLILSAFLAQVIVLFLLVAGQGAAAVGEVGGPPNECYAMMPTDLPITISYSKSSSTSATSFTFLVSLTPECM